MPAVLFYGTDAGLVSERAAKLAAIVAARDNPPGEIIRMEDADLDNDPDRLAVELQTIPMFGGSKVVRATAGRRITAAALEPFIAGDRLAATLIVEGGNLRPTDTLRTLFEKAPKAAAVACYPDEGHDLETLVRDTLKGHGLAISPEARDLLLTRVGADRALSRGEIDKLALYAAGKSEIDVSDVEAIVGDASQLAIDRVLDGAAGGDAKRAVAEYARALAAGESAQTIILAAQRHLEKLHKHPLRHRPGPLVRGRGAAVAPADPLQAEGRYRPAVPPVDNGAAVGGAGASFRRGKGRAVVGTAGGSHRRGAADRSRGGRPPGASALSVLTPPACPRRRAAYSAPHSAIRGTIWGP